MMKQTSNIFFNRGLTLVELMVGLTISLFLLSVIVAVFVGSRTLFRVTSSQERQSETGRLVLNLFQQELRNTGFVSCHPKEADAMQSTLVTLAGFLDANSAGIFGYQGKSGGITNLDSAIVPATGSTLVNESDVLSIRVAVDNLTLGLIAPMSLTTSVPKVGTALSTNTFTQGDVALMADCKNAVLFRITETDPKQTGQLSHDTTLNSTTDLKHVYSADAMVYRMQTHHYFVATSVLHPGVNALWRLTVPAPAGTVQPEEIITGVDGVAFSYGVDTQLSDNVMAATQYKRADAMTSDDWNQVTAVRIEVLSSTVQTGVAVGGQASVNFADQERSFSDSRLHKISSDLVTLRNRVP